MSKAVLIHYVGVVEEQVVFGRQLNLDVLEVVWLTLLKAILRNSRIYLLTSWQILTLIASSVPTSCGPLLGSYFLSSKGASRSYATECPSAIGEKELEIVYKSIF